MKANQDTFHDLKGSENPLQFSNWCASRACRSAISSSVSCRTEGRPVWEEWQARAVDRNQALHLAEEAAEDLQDPVEAEVAADHPYRASEVVEGHPCLAGAAAVEGLRIQASAEEVAHPFRALAVEVVRRNRALVAVEAHPCRASAAAVEQTNTLPAVEVEASAWVRCPVKSLRAR